ncbi:MAG: hypothetical protein LBV16_03035 [Elusimicrobiota bacterium]|jgi:predicted outer membrane repeat protein|nr:hypothetical protein [Elusimicrobiota bacterium]
MIQKILRKSFFIVFILFSAIYAFALDFDTFKSNFESGGTQNWTLTSSFVFTSSVSAAPAGSIYTINGMGFEVSGLYPFISTYTAANPSLPVWTTNTFSGLAFAGNSTLDASNIIFEKFGGLTILMGDNATLDLLSVSFTSNSAVIKVGENSNITIDNVNFSGNKGKALDMGKNSTADIANSIFNSNAGGINISEDSAVTIADTQFLKNSGSDFGAIYNKGSLTINGNTIFNENNSGNTSVMGGAIANYGTLDLDSTSGDISFSSNTFNYPSGWSVVPVPGSIYNDIFASIKISGSANSVVINDGVLGQGTIEKTGAGSLFINGDGSNFTGTFIQTDGDTTVGESGVFFAGTNLIYNSVLNVTAGAVSYSVKLGSNAVLNHYNNSNRNISNIYGNSISFTSNNAIALFDKKNSIEDKAYYRLLADIKGPASNTAQFNNSIVSFYQNEYKSSASYILNDSVLDLIASNAMRKIKFSNLEILGDTSMNFGIYISASKRGQVDADSDILVLKMQGQGGTIKVGDIRIFGDNAENMNMVIGSTFSLLVFSGNLNFDASKGIIATTKFVYEYEAFNSTGLNLKVSQKTDGNTLSKINKSSHSVRQFGFSYYDSAAEPYKLASNLGAASSGSFLVLGYDIFSSHSVLSGENKYSFFNISNNNTDFRLSNLTIQKAFSSSSGSALLFTNSQSTAEIRNVYFQNNTASGSGGVIYVKDTKISLSSVSFNRNTAGLKGGVFYIENATAAFYDSAAFLLNTAKKEGGAIYALNSIIDFIDYAGATITFSSNTAFGGGGSMFLSASSVTFNNKVMVDSSSSGFLGGAFYLSASTMSFNKEITIQNSIAVSSGGALYLQNSNIDFKSAAIFGNVRSSGAGGVIFAIGGSYTHFEDSVNITSSFAKLDGGSFYLNFGSSIIFNKSLTIENSKSSGAGGSFYLNGNSYAYFAAPVSVKQSSAVGAGGVFYITNSTAVFNDSFSVEKSFSKSYGGSFYSVSNPYIFFRGAVNIKYSTASNAGGAFFVRNSSIIFNSSVDLEGSRAKGSGGGFYIDNSYLKFASGFNVKQSSAAGSGGSFYINQSTMSVKGAISLEYGTAAQLGGHIYANNSSLTFYGDSSISISKGFAVSSGGALYIINSSASFTSMSFSVSDSISSRGAGGGLFLGNSYMIFDSNKDVNFNNNKASGFGGGAFIVNSTAVFNGVYVSFSNNISSKSSGGGLYIKNSSLSFTGLREVNFNNNTAGVKAGAIYLENSFIILESSMARATFNSNTAFSSGGAVYIDRNSTMTINRAGGNTDFASNVVYSSTKTISGAGGAIFNAGILNLDISSGSIIFSDNRVEWKENGESKRKNNDIYNTQTGIINITGVRSSTEINPTLDFNSGIAGSGTINQNSYQTVNIRGGNDSDWTGTFRQTTGTTRIEGNFLTKNGNKTIIEGGTLVLGGGSVISTYTYVSSGIVKTQIQLWQNAVLQIDADQLFVENMITNGGTGNFGKIFVSGGRVEFGGDYSSFDGGFIQDNNNTVLITSKVFGGNKDIVKGTFEISSNAIVNGAWTGSINIGQEGNLRLNLSSGSNVVLDSMGAIAGHTYTSNSVLTTDYGRITKTGDWSNMVVNGDYSRFSFTQEGNGTTTVRNNFFGGHNYLNGGFVILEAGSSLINTSTVEVNGGTLIIDNGVNNTLLTLRGGGTIYQNSGNFEVLNSEYSGRLYLNDNNQFKATGNTFGYSVTLGTNTQFTHLANSDQMSNIDGGRVQLQGINTTVLFGRDAGFSGNANYSLNGKLENGYNSLSNQITFEHSNITFGSEQNFTGSTTYKFQDSVIDLSRNQAARTITFDHFENNNNSIILGIGFDSNGNVQSDKLVVNNLVGSSQIEFEMLKIYEPNTNLAIGVSSHVAVLDGLTFASNKAGIYATTQYEYDFSVNAGANYIDLYRVSIANGYSLNKVNAYQGLRVFSFSSVKIYDIWEDLSAMADGDFNVLGYNTDASSSVLSGGGIYSFFKLSGAAVSFNVRDLTIQSALSFSSGSVFYMTNNSSASLYNTIIKDNISRFDGGSIYADGNSLISVRLSSFTNNKAGNSGGAFYISQSTAAFSETIYFISNFAKNGGALYGSNASLFFKDNSDIIFNSNIATSSGGAISIVNNSSAEFRGQTLFLKNTSYAGGGAISVSGSTLAFYRDGISFIANRAGNGGAISLQENSAVSFDASVYFSSNNASSNGGALFADNSYLYFNRDKSVDFTSNTANKGGAFAAVNFSSAFFDGHAYFTSNTAIADGGAVFADNVFIEFAQGRNVDFKLNKALQNGGALNAANGGSITFKGYVAFERNTALVSGGAINVDASFIEFSTESRANFTFNAALSSGGAVNLINGAAIVFNREITGFSSNTASLIGGAVHINNSLADFNPNTTVYFIWNTAQSSGGAIALENGGKAVFNSQNYADISIYFENNKSSSSGGAIYAKDSFVYFGSHTSVYFNNNISSGGFGSAIGLTASSMIFDNNVTMTNGVSKNKGGSNNLIYADGSSITFNGKDAVLRGTITAQGSAIIAKNGSLIEFKGGNLTFEYFNNNDGDGGVFYNDATSTISFSSHSNITAKGNSAKNGGFMKYDGLGLIEFYGNMTFTENTASSKGGALYIINGTTLAFYNSVTFDGNKSNTDGGAVYIDEASFVDFSSASLTANKNEGKNGGFMFLKNKDMIFFKDITMSENKASQTGGALKIENSSLTFEKGAAFSSNKSTGAGGAIYALNSFFEVKDTGASNFTSNVSSASGGAFYLNGSTAIFNNANMQFMTNLAKSSGGAIYMENSSYGEFNNSIFYSSGNIANIGGGAYIKNSSAVFNSKQYTVFDSNIAQNGGLGGGLYAENSSVTFDSEITYFQNNKADNHGGGLYVAKGAEISLKNANFISNTSGKEGGGIYVAEKGVLNYTVEDYKEAYIYQNVAKKANVFDYDYTNLPSGIHIASGGVVNFHLNGADAIVHIVDIISSEEGSQINIDGTGIAQIYSAADLYEASVNDSAQLTVISQATMKVSTLTLSGNSVLYLADGARMFSEGTVFLNDYSNMTMQNGSFLASGKLNISSNAVLSLQNDLRDSVYINEINNTSGTFEMDVFRNAAYDQISSDKITISQDTKLHLNANIKDKDYRRRYYFLFSTSNGIEGKFDKDNIMIDDIFLSSTGARKISELNQIINDYIMDYGVLFKDRIVLVLDGDKPSQTDIAKTPNMSFNQKSVAQNLDALSTRFDSYAVSTMNGDFNGGDLDYIISALYEDMTDSERLAALSEIAPYFLANVFLGQNLISQRTDIYSRIMKPDAYGGTNGTWARYQGGVAIFNADENSIGQFRNSNSGTIFGLDKFDEYYQIEYGFFGRFNTAYPNQSASNATIETYSFGLYGGAFDDEIELRTMLGMNIGKYEVNRVIMFMGRTARGEFTSVDANFDVEVSYRLNVNDRIFRPFGGFYAMMLHQPNFTEKGADSLNLTYMSDILFRTAIRCGIATDGQLFDGSLQWSASLSGDYILSGVIPQFKAELEGTGEPFEYRGVDLGNIFVEVSLNLNYSITDSMSIYGGGSFKGAGSYQDYSGSFGLRYFLD